MSNLKRIESALISVYHKDGLEPLVKKLNSLGVKMYSTGGTETFIRELGFEVTAVEDLTSYPSILGGRVKTLHPKVFGGILNRRDNESDQQQLSQYEVPEIDLVIVDLYPFEETLASGASEEAIIEKIDIGGISLIRAAAKNYRDVICISSRNQYAHFLQLLESGQGKTSIDHRKKYAAQAFNISSHYDTEIFHFFNEDQQAVKLSITDAKELRYGENPHQKAHFFGDFDKAFDQLNGKEVSYNNLLDIDAAVHLMREFSGEKPTFAILKHNNACGLAQRPSLLEAYRAALAADPVSAFGGILISNSEIDEATAWEIDQLFCEVVIAPAYSRQALDTLKNKKNRILLVQKDFPLPQTQLRSCLNGYLQQERDSKTDSAADLKYVTDNKPNEKELSDLLFASKICKHTKSNTIVLVKDHQLLASGTGQTSRVDALKQSIEKAQNFKFDLRGAAMASDAFFPFPDCVEIASKAGIKSVIQPGGSIKDQLSIDFCNENNLAMVMTGTRHFKH